MIIVILYKHKNLLKKVTPEGPLLARDSSYSHIYSTFISRSFSGPANFGKELSIKGKKP